MLTKFIERYPVDNLLDVNYALCLPQTEIKIHNFHVERKKLNKKGSDFRLGYVS